MVDSCLVEGQRVSVGDTVCFKSDVEQCGKISAIRRNHMNKAELTLTSEHGFHGDYIGGNNITTELASDCWVE